jgi:hypothetical protein
MSGKTKMKIYLIMLLIILAGMTNKLIADFTFDEPTNLGPTVNSSAADAVPTISGDGLELYFTSDRPGGQGGNDIWVSKRATIEDDWG